MIRLTDLGKTYGPKTALAPVSVTFAEHSFTCIVGKSGCGKTTLLRLLSGLEEKTAGSVEGLPRRIAPVFQEPRLMPWLTVAQNIAFAARHDPSLWDGDVPDGSSAKSVEARKYGPCCESSAWNTTAASIRRNCPAAWPSACPWDARCSTTLT